RLPNIGFNVIAGSPGTSLVKAAFACSEGFGIFMGARATAIILTRGRAAGGGGDRIEKDLRQRPRLAGLESGSKGRGAGHPGAPRLRASLRDRGQDRGLALRSESVDRRRSREVAR